MSVLNFACLVLAYLFFSEKSQMTLETVDFMVSCVESVFGIVRKSDKMLVIYSGCWHGTRSD